MPNFPIARAGQVQTPGPSPQASVDTTTSDALLAASDGLNALAQGEIRISQSENAVARASAVSAYSEAANEELRRIQTEGDLTDPATAQAYGKFLQDKRSEILNNHSGGSESRDALDVRLEAIRSTAVSSAGQMAFTAQRKKVMDQLGRDINDLTANAIEDPASLPELYASLDGIVDDMAPALTPDEEETFRDAGRAEIALSAMQGKMARGDVRGAQEIYSIPGVRDVMKPAQQRQMEATFAEFERKQTEVLDKFNQRVDLYRTVTGQEPSMSMRLQLAGMDAGGSKMDDLRQIESVMGPLTREQRLEYLGVSPTEGPEPYTDAAKTVLDREMLIEQFGEGSIQLAAFDEEQRMGDDPDPSDEAKVRSEFTGLSKDFVKIRDAYSRIVDVGQDPSAAGDLALIFNYMKMLDPGSTVREGEFANAQNSGGVGERIISMYNRVLRGERLSEVQRTDFLDRSGDLMRAQMRGQMNLENQYRGIAERNNLDVDDVVVDFVGDIRNGLGSGGAQQSGAADEGPEEDVVEYDINGKRIAKAGE